MTDLQKFKKDELIKFIKKEIEKHDKYIKKEYINRHMWSEEFNEIENKIIFLMNMSELLLALLFILVIIILFITL